MNFLRLFSKLNYYKSIDEMPIFNWFKIQETNDLSYLLYKKRGCTPKQAAILKEALQLMTNEYIDTFGISDQYKNILELKRDIRVKEILFATTGEKINKTFISVLQSKLKVALESTQKSDTGSVIVHVNKYMGYRADLKKISVKEFYSILNEIKKEATASTGK